MDNTNIKNVEEFINYKKLIIHAGCFHADDVFTAAYVNILRKWMNLPPLKIIRTFNIQPAYTEENGYLVADIGKGRFDHHQPNEEKECRANGIPYAAFGKVVREYHFMLTEDEYKLFDKKFIEPIDNHDNTGCGNHLSFAISAFNKHWNSDDPNEETVQFFKALELATTILNEMINNIKSLALAKTIADNSKIENNTVYLDNYIPIAEFLTNNDEAKFIGSPSQRGGYQVMSIRDVNGNNKELFDDEYIGLNLPDGQSLENGMTFCHSSGFLAAFKDKKYAKEFMKNRNRR